MPRGYPDYNNPFYSIAAQSSDFSQIISAFTGIRPIDNLGYLAYAETFRDGLGGWTRSFLGGSTEMKVNGFGAEVPPVGLVWHSDGTVPGFNASLTHGFANDLRDRWGLDTAVRLLANPPELRFLIFQRIGADSLSFTFRINASTLLLEADHEGVWIQLSPEPIALASSLFVPLKFVVDFADRTIPRVVVGGTRVHPDGEFGTVLHPGGTLIYTSVGLLCYNVLGITQAAYCGHAYITVDEP
jgi:hypothetical protein